MNLLHPSLCIQGVSPIKDTGFMTKWNILNLKIQFAEFNEDNLYYTNNINEYLKSHQSLNKLEMERLQLKWYILYLSTNKGIIIY
jgi:hypothetical protein